MTHLNFAQQHSLQIPQRMMRCKPASAAPWPTRPFVPPHGGAAAGAAHHFVFISIPEASKPSAAGLLPVFMHGPWRNPFIAPSMPHTTLLPRAGASSPLAPFPFLAAQPSMAVLAACLPTARALLCPCSSAAPSCGATTLPLAERTCAAQSAFPAPNFVIRGTASHGGSNAGLNLLRRQASQAAGTTEPRQTASQILDSNFHSAHIAPPFSHISHSHCVPSASRPPVQFSPPFKPRR